MSKYMLVIASFISVSFFNIPSAHAQFEHIYETHHENSYFEIDSVGTDHWWINTHDGFEYTHNGGKDWHVSTVPDNIDTTQRTLYRMDFITENVGFCLGFQYGLTFWQEPRDAILYRTRDGGETWTAIESLPHHTAVLDYTFSSELVGWAAIRTGAIYRTEDGGDTWIQAREYVEDWTVVTDIGCVNETTCYIIYTNRFTLVSKEYWTKIDITYDTGTTWNTIGPSYQRYPLNIMPSPSGKYSILLSNDWGSSISGGVGYFIFDVMGHDVTPKLSFEPQKLYKVRWRDDDTVWFMKLDELNEYNSSGGRSDDDLNYSFAVSHDHGVTTQHVFDIPRPLYPEYIDHNYYTDYYFISDFTVLDDGSILVLGGLGDVFRYTPETTDVAEPHTNPESDIMLFPPAPNPFNPSTTIRFALAAPETVTVTVYDTAGRTVATLMDTVPLAAGRHEVVFDGAHYASGVYVFRVTAGDAVKTGKMVLVK